jgi:Flp pilus assembly protein TadD
MRERTYADERPFDWIVYAVAIGLGGALIGYVLAVAGHTDGVGQQAASGAPAATVVAAGVPVVDESALRAYRDILARDPKNFQAAVNAGNLLYDAQRYPEAIALYQQAFAVNGADINVSTDLGSALWYSGRAEEALAQYERSLAIDPTHPQTLFNVGIVRAEGKQDDAGAVAAWEKLVAAHPDYPDLAATRERIAAARARIARR